MLLLSENPNTQSYCAVCSMYTGYQNKRLSTRLGKRDSLPALCVYGKFLVDKKSMLIIHVFMDDSISLQKQKPTHYSFSCKHASTKKSNKDVLLDTQVDLIVEQTYSARKQDSRTVLISNWNTGDTKRIHCLTSVTLTSHMLGDSKQVGGGGGQTATSTLRKTPGTLALGGLGQDITPGGWVSDLTSIQTSLVYV